MSARQVSIAVTLLTGRYHGEEWPPSPARLFQALVAGVMTGACRAHSAAVEPALRWLERQPAPRIHACGVESRQPYRIAVPNNDMDVIAREWFRGRAADPAKLRTMKTIHAKDVEGDGPHIQYAWKLNQNEDAQVLEPLRIASHCLHTLGWGVDMAFANVEECGKPAAVYEPADSGAMTLAVPMEGTLDDLYGAYARFTRRAQDGGVDAHTRPSMLRMQPYRLAGDIIRPVAEFFLMKPESDEPKSVPGEQCMKVAGWLRHAAAEVLATEFEAGFIETYVQGHGRTEHEPRRLSYLPLPNIFPDGLIRRALIAEPPGARGEVARMLRRKLAGRVLTDIEGREVCSLALARRRDWNFQQYLAMGGFQRWRSVTPVVLHGFNAGRKGEISITKTERLLLRAFEMAGYGEGMIEGLSFQGAPWWRATRHASAIRVPEHLRGYPRVHVEVRFRRPVSGPVIAGIGRHYGIGLFATAAGDAR